MYCLSIDYLFLLELENFVLPLMSESVSEN